MTWVVSVANKMPVTFAKKAVDISTNNVFIIYTQIIIMAQLVC